MKYTFILIALFLFAPMTAMAGGPSVFVDLANDDVIITKAKDNSQVKLDYDNVDDLQAMKIRRNDKTYIVVLRWKKDVVRMLAYTPDGKKVGSEKVLSADGAKDFHTVRLEYKKIDDKPRLQVRGVKLNEGGEPVKLIRKRYRVNPTKDDPIKYKSSKKTDIKYPDMTGLTDAEQGHKLFNYWRKSSGLFPAKRVGSLDESCSKHAYYMKVNDIIEHAEDPSLPGYTEEGDFAGRGANLTAHPGGSMVTSMKILMNGTYHRILMIVNELTGYGFAIDGPAASGKYYGCQEITSRVDGFAVSGDKKNKTYFDSANTRWPIVAPGAGEERVPTTMNQGEWPDPLYNFGSNYPSGYPITATVGTFHTDLHLKIYDPEGNQVFAYFQPPGDQNDPAVLYQGVSYSLIPASPLRGGTRYKVRMTGKYKGDSFTREWYFTTE